jgi:hypothetical protein
MNDIRYQRGKVYTIRSHKTDLVYVGSTIEPHLSNRLSGHRRAYKAYKNSGKKYCTVYDILEIDEDCYIELHENYSCNNKYELHRREGEVIREINCCNKCKPGRTLKEWREDNKEKIKEYMKEYSKQYYANNKEEILAKKKQKYNCECGSNIRYHDKSKHFKTKKHQAFINQ